VADGDQFLGYGKDLAARIARIRGLDPGPINAVDVGDLAAIADAQLRNLVAAAVELRDAFAGADVAAWNAAMAVRRNTRNTLRSSILDALAEPVRSVPPLRDLLDAINFDDANGISIGTRIGRSKFA
jgi:hypothetical protein